MSCTFIVAAALAVHQARLRQVRCGMDGFHLLKNTGLLFSIILPIDADEAGEHLPLRQDGE